MTERHEHDRFFRKWIEYKENLQEFLMSYLADDIKAVIDISSATIENTNLISDQLKEDITDVLVSVKRKDTQETIFVLIEHLSSRKTNIVYRLLKYTVAICEKYKDKGIHDTHPSLVVPILYYNGSEYYNPSPSVWPFPRDLLNYRFEFINVISVPDKELANKKHIGIFEYFMKNIHSVDILEVWQNAFNLFIPYFEDNADQIKVLVSYTLTKIDEKDKIKLDKLIKSNIKQGETIMASVAYKLKQEGIEEGEQRGLAKGRKKEAVTIAKNLLQEKVETKLIAKTTGVSETDIEKLARGEEINIDDNE